MLAELLSLTFLILLGKRGHRGWGTGQCVAFLMLWEKVDREQKHQEFRRLFILFYFIEKGN